MYMNGAFPREYGVIISGGGVCVWRGESAGIYAADCRLLRSVDPTVFAMRVQVILFSALMTAVSARPEKADAKKSEEKSTDSKTKRGLFDVGLGHDFGGFGGGLELSHASLHHDEGHITGVTIHKEVKVPVPAPYPVEKEIPVPYPVHVKVPVDRPVPYHVPAPYPVPVEKHIPVPVEKPVPYPVHVPVKVAVEEPYPVHVPYKVPVAVEKPLPYPVKVPYVVKESYPVFVKDHHHEHHFSDFHGFH
ncbi:uncharacterized protein LOC131672868 [Phymastichus coffea]|uniref:uncharacterized protein LOC131672868 n=1 Tax=Phymastichus coffea TaxID=108790 RepID=UPI00273BF4F0|nr:uncharacterized protein LOC131672868 [Phymastichus coffea]